MKTLLRFWLLAIGLSVAALVVARLGPEGWSATRVPITVAKYGPSLAGILAAGLWSGSGEVRRLLRAALPTRRSLPWLLVALALPTLVYLGALVAVAPTTVPQLFNVPSLSSFGGLLGVRLFLGGGFGEEFGWRGWLLPTLARERSPLFVVISIGVAHGLWHAPASGIASAVALCSLTIPWSVIFAWLYFASGRNVLVCALAHAVGNAWVPVVAQAAPSAAGPWTFAVVVLSCILAVWAFARLRPLWPAKAPQ